MVKRALAIAGLALSLTLTQALLAEHAWAETPTFTLTFKEDGTFEPQRRSARWSLQDQPHQ